MKATVILMGLLAIALLSVLGDPAAVAATVTTKALEPVWMMLSGASLIALGTAVRRYIP
jgi:hypothetical protein